LIYSTLVEHEADGTTVRPGLAEAWESNANTTEWTFHLRYGVTLSNGASLDANNVAASLIALWDAKDANHTGRTGRFEIFQRLFGTFVPGTLR